MSGPGIYLHLPFCSAICPYCDFAVTVGGEERRGRFADALLHEIALGLPESFPADSSRGFDTIYFGGGTPSLIGERELKRIVAALRQHLPVAAECWIGLEANPEDVSPESLAGWREAGVTFLSLGVQSLENDALRFLGRRHDGATSRRSIEQALEAGFPTVSFDLIYARPGQTPESWRGELEEAAGFGAQHLSCYQLTVAEGTPFFLRRERGALTEMPEARQTELFLETHLHLAELGYAGYEVSNFAAAPEHRSRHNLKYWHHVPYLGLGPAAHSFDGRRRWWNERDEAEWRARLASSQRPVADRETLTDEQLALEHLFLGLRTADGISPGLLRERYGFDLEAANAEMLRRLESEGRLVAAEGRLTPTLLGLAGADAMVRDLVIPGAEGRGHAAR